MAYLMKAKIIRDDIEVNLAEITAESGLMDCVAYVEKMRNGRKVPVPHWKVGTILEAPNAFRLVQFGVAVPADEACAARANRTPAQMLESQHAYERLVRGISSEDFDLFDAGVITGYDPETGDYLPGENWHLLEKMRPTNIPLLDNDEDE